VAELGVGIDSREERNAPGHRSVSMWFSSTTTIEFCCREIEVEGTRRARSGAVRMIGAQCGTDVVCASTSFFRFESPVSLSGPPSWPELVLYRYVQRSRSSSGGAIERAAGTRETISRRRTLWECMQCRSILRLPWSAR
jgi:hypothetical protein